MKEDEHFKKQFPRRAFSRMNALGITQKELAKKLKISQPTMSHYLSGQSVPKITIVKKMSRLLECDAGWLGCFYDRKKNPDMISEEAEEEDIKEEKEIDIPVEENVIHDKEIVTEEKETGWHLKPKDGWTNDTLPPMRGQDGSNPFAYQLVVEYKQSRASTEVGEKVDIRVQGIGWLNDIWKDKTGFIMYAQQLSNTKLAYVHDKPVAFRYSQLIAWKDLEAYKEDKE